MNVRRIEPLIRHFAGYRHAPPQYRPAMRPITEVGEGHNAITRHPRHFPQDMLGVMHGLQGLRKHDSTELLIVEESQALFQVLLDHLTAAPPPHEHIPPR